MVALVHSALPVFSHSASPLFSDDSVQGCLGFFLAICAPPLGQKGPVHPCSEPTSGSCGCVIVQEPGTLVSPYTHTDTRTQLQELLSSAAQEPLQRSWQNNTRTHTPRNKPLALRVCLRPVSAGSGNCSVDIQAQAGARVREPYPFTQPPFPPELWELETW